MSFAIISKAQSLTKEEINIILERHNYWRHQVGVTQNLQWSGKLSKIAYQWAKKLKNQKCAFKHSKNEDYGENLFQGTSGYFDASYVVDAWAGEKVFYNYETNQCKKGEMCGHYTQIVWKKTAQVGCAKIVCNDLDIWVCNYDPPGNWIGEKPY